MSDPLDDYLDDFGTRLDERAARPRGRRPLVRRVALAAAAAVIVAVAVVLLDTGSPSRPVDAVAAARDAVTPTADEIVHLSITSRLSARGDVRVSAPRTRRHEQWVGVAPNRWRAAERTDPDPDAPRPSDPAGRRVEYAYGDGRYVDWDASRNRVTVTSPFAEDGDAARAPGPFGGDLQRTLPELLRTGEVRDLGIVRARGRQVRRLVRVEKPGDGLVGRTLTYDVDAQTSAPVGGELRFLMRSRRGRPGGPTTETTSELIQTFVVDVYERLPVTPRTARLLTVRPPAGTPLVEYRLRRDGRGRVRVASCRVPADGSLACPRG
jgi:hypothetical protein